MLNQFANIKKLILLGIAVGSTKVMLLLFAYFFDAETYNQFNQIYYTASILILFGSLGFNIAVTRLNIDFTRIGIAVAANAILVYLFLQIVSAPFGNLFQIVSIIIYSIFISLTGILAFQLLFSGRHKEYVVLALLYSVLHLLIIPAVIILGINLFSLLPVIAVLWFLLGLPKYIKPRESTYDKFNNFYKIGLSAFIINSAVSLALAADKYFVNHYFTIEIANAYTFAWGLVAPMFYIGVIIEQFLFSEQNTSKANILRRGLTLSTSLVITYVILMTAGINLFPQILPASISYDYIISVFTLMISGYSFYVIFHFPVNAYLFKSLGTETQKTISVIFSIVISVFVVVYIMIMQGFFEINYIWLLVITWSYIFTLLIAKAIIMFRRDSVEEAIQTTFEIKNLEP